ncbi:hypothetical protein [Elizabethkingia ursingii]|uniref:hypothetical protein n=1 Tax=Elizabethkingia ursingii TaxID=1756150 RepID=UPI00075128C3|nr:hypothetical protein [Elizabethkingia ursingii]KUY29812.1 hypothetical protein ATB96_17730 [Elizabethkingia ursingii]
MTVRNKIEKYLVEGLSPAEIVEALKNEGTPRQLEAVEKSINLLKKAYKAKTLVQLGYKIFEKNIIEYFNNAYSNKMKD